MKQIQLFNCMIKSELKNLNVSAKPARSKTKLLLSLLSLEEQVEKLKNFFFRLFARSVLSFLDALPLDNGGEFRWMGTVNIEIVIINVIPF